MESPAASVGGFGPADSTGGAWSAYALGNLLVCAGFSVGNFISGLQDGLLEWP